MAASAWVLYNKAKNKIGTGAIVLSTAPMKMKLTKSASNAETLTLSLLSSVDNEISARGGYVAGGRALANKSWGVGASAKQYKLDADDLVFTASGSDLINVKYAVIGASGAAGVHALCWSKLTTGNQFTVTSPNTLTIVFDSAGIFTIV